MLDAPRPGFGLLRLVDGATSEWIPTDEYGDFAEWSPDGVSLFCHVQDEIRVRNTVTGNEVVVASPAKDGVTAYYAAWSMDGSIVYYVARTASNWVINSVTAAGGASTRLVEFDDPTRASTKYGFATDDRTFYMTLGSPESDSFVAELE